MLVLYVATVWGGVLLGTSALVDMGPGLAGVEPFGGGLPVRCCCWRESQCDNGVECLIVVCNRGQPAGIWSFYLPPLNMYEFGVQFVLPFNFFFGVRVKSITFVKFGIKVK